MDLVLISATLQIVWYIFTSLFLLYKFTSFFQSIYNFGKMIYKIKDSMYWIKTKVIGITKSVKNRYTGNGSIKLSDPESQITEYYSPSQNGSLAKLYKMEDTQTQIEMQESRFQDSRMYSKFLNSLKETDDNNVLSESNQMIEKEYHQDPEEPEHFASCTESQLPPFANFK